MPSDGTLRIKTVGEADVRCRLFDPSGHLVFEGSDNGSDWNCALAEPLKRGDYTLVLETETQVAGSTRLILSTPKTEALGPLADGQTIKVAVNVSVLEVPAQPGDAAAEIDLNRSGRSPARWRTRTAKWSSAARARSTARCRVRPGPTSTACGCGPPTASRR